VENQARKKQRIAENLDNGLSSKGRPLNPGPGKGRRRRLVDRASRNARRKPVGPMILKLERLMMENGKTEMDWEAEHRSIREDELYQRRRVGDVITTVNGDVWAGGNMDGGGMDEEKRGGGDDDDYAAL